MPVSLEGACDELFAAVPEDDAGRREDLSLLMKRDSFPGSIAQ